MTEADNPVGSAGQSGGRPQGASSGHAALSSADLVIVGGGVMGLWAAVKAGRLGLRTLLLEAHAPGHGASGGLLGALMPHMPDRWNDKKQFQFDALLQLEEEVAAIEAETRLSCGYRRVGRYIPLPKPHLAVIAERHSIEAGTNWHQQGHAFHWHVMKSSQIDGWPDAAFTEAGLVHDTFAARVFPRSLCAGLVAVIRATPHVDLVEGAAVAGIDPVLGRVTLENGETIGFGHCIVAAGHRAFPLIEGLDAGDLQRKPLGQPVKGQAALLAAAIDPAFPVIFLNGLYVVAHEGGHVAIGSTSEEEFYAPFSTDDKLDDLILRARALVPGLADAPVIERWAGLRPKAIDGDPMVGPHPRHPSVISLAGGFKVSFGLAHRLADAALAGIVGKPVDLPTSFTLAHHLSVAAQ
jgi:glycine oxidase